MFPFLERDKNIRLIKGKKASFFKFNRKKNKKLREIIFYKYKNKLSLFKCFILLLIIFFIFVLGVSILMGNESMILISTIFQKKEEKYEFEFDSLELSFNKSLDFLKKCMNGKLDYKITEFKSIDNPILSVVIPAYNCEKFITRLIRSIENQNILELEIILVNDFSKDNTLLVLKQLQTADQRIKILNNKNNKGILYSRSIGCLSSKGKYIFPIDNDDMILDKDVFEAIINIANNKSIDMIEFRGISIPNSQHILKGKIKETAFSNHRLNVLMKQPQLSDYPLQPGAKTGDLIFKDLCIWRKCIKSEMYKKVLNTIGEERYSRYMIGHEDVIINFSLFNTVNTFLFIGKYGILRIYKSHSANKRTKAINQEIKQIYLLDVALIYLKKTKQYPKLIYYLINNVLKLKLLKHILYIDGYKKKILNSCLDRFFNCSFIPKPYKKDIKAKLKKLNFFNYNF